MAIKSKPAKSQWTDEQWRAISESGQNMLVAAAAGSGKTAVLVERIIQKLTDKHHPVDIDRLLIVTFTNAAAAEMRTRIGQALEKELQRRPGSYHLRRQLALLNRAMISTLHSFCLNVVRQYYFQLELDPQFRLMDETEAELIREEVLAELLEEAYGQEENSHFYVLVDSYTSDRGDAELAALISKIYDFSRAHPDPDRWLEEIAASYDVEAETRLDELPWTQHLMEAIKLRLAGCRAQVEQMLSLTEAPGGPEAYGERLRADLEQIDALLCSDSWRALAAQLQNLKWGRLSPVRSQEVDQHLKERVQGWRKKVREELQKLEKLLCRSSEELISDIRNQAPLVRTLITLVRQFGERYWQEKKARGLVDFNDLEHLALRILRNEQPLDDNHHQDSWAPSEVALQFQEQFQEVLVDEYQDTNLVQETILRLITRGDNLFMVGDVKQSIYRFRLAEPSLFLDKYRRFTSTGGGQGLRIDLNRNFRSRPQVLAAANYIFRQIMDTQVGEISYDQQAELTPGATYPDLPGQEAELLIINRGEALNSASSEIGKKGETLGSEGEEELVAAQLEARLVARRIRELVDGGRLVVDKGGALRPITYRDIVILMRSMAWASTLTEELSRAGIPVYAELSTGYFEATEVSTMLALLRVIDNPDQDIPLAAVLRSPIVGMSESELALIRMQAKGGSFFTALKAAIDTLAQEPLGKKLARFYRQLQRWRLKARQGALSELIWQLYRDTGYFDYVGGLPGGRQRQANLKALYDRARAYEQTSFRGLFRFLRFIERIQDRGSDLGTARALGEQEDVVRLMTIHKSKGLEFPVVFVVGLGRKFNQKDIQGDVLLHKNLGLGCRYVDPQLRLAYPTLPQLALKEKLRLEMLAEEMRILYVALTRAKEKLYLVGSLSSVESSIERWQQWTGHEGWLLPVHLRAAAQSHLDWIGPALLRHRVGREWLSSHQGRGWPEAVHDPSEWKLSFIDADQLKESWEKDEEEAASLWAAVKNGEPVPLGSASQQEVMGQLSWEYPFQQATQHRSKQSVTEMKRHWLSPDTFTDTRYIPAKTVAFERPRFVQERGLSALEKGTAMHLVMQHVPLSKPPSEAELRQLVEQMVTRELLTTEQAAAIDVDAIRRFFESELGHRLLRAPFVRREVPFSFGLAASEAYPDWSGEAEERVLIQGVIDCLFRDKEGLVLIDYKTDQIEGRFHGGFEEARPVLLKRYQLQVGWYARAVEEIWKEEVKAKYLYFFDGGHLLQVP